MAGWTRRRCAVPVCYVRLFSGAVGVPERSVRQAYPTHHSLGPLVAPFDGETRACENRGIRERTANDVRCGSMQVLCRRIRVCLVLQFYFKFFFFFLRGWGYGRRREVVWMTLALYGVDRHDTRFWLWPADRERGRDVAERACWSCSFQTLCQDLGGCSLSLSRGGHFDHRPTKYEVVVRIDKLLPIGSSRKVTLPL